MVDVLFISPMMQRNAMHPKCNTPKKCNTCLRVQHIVHGGHIVLLPHDAAAHAAQLLHVPAGAQQQAQVHAQRPHVGARLAAAGKQRGPEKAG